MNKCNLHVGRCGFVILLLLVPCAPALASPVFAPVAIAKAQIENHPPLADGAVLEVAPWADIVVPGPDGPPPPTAAGAPGRARGRRRCA